MGASATRFKAKKTTSEMPLFAYTEMPMMLMNENIENEKILIVRQNFQENWIFLEPNLKK